MASAPPLRRFCILVLVGLLVLPAGIGSGTAARQESLTVGLDTPASANVGESVSINATVQTPELPGAYERQLTVTLYIDGQARRSTSVRIADGESTTVSFQYLFETEGTHDIRTEATVTLGGRSFTSSAATNIDIKPAVEQIRLEGAAFAVPKSLEDEVATYRTTSAQASAPYAFILATQEELYLVFTHTKPQKGKATVEGRALETNISSGNLTFGVITATRVAFDTVGTETTVREVATNSNRYRLELVRITATYRRLTTLTDPDKGQNFTLSTTTGILVNNPRTASSLMEQLGAKARVLSQTPNTDRIDAMLEDPRQPHLHTFSFETEFWTDATATVDAIVLDPESAARRFITEFDRAGVAHAEPGEPVLYLVNDDFNPQPVDSVQSVTTRSTALDGEVVTLEANLYQTKISVQETIEHATGCGQDKAQLKGECKNIIQDELLHGGVAWTGTPTRTTDLLWVMGVSSRHQDMPTNRTHGRYRLVGEVVSTARLNESLPEGVVLVVIDLERVGDSNYATMSQEARARIQTRAARVTDPLATHVTSSLSATDTQQTQTGTQIATPTAATTATPTATTRTTSGSTTTSAAGPGFGLGKALLALLALGLIALSHHRRT